MCLHWLKNICQQLALSDRDPLWVLGSCYQMETAWSRGSAADRALPSSKQLLQMIDDMHKLAATFAEDDDKRQQVYKQLREYYKTETEMDELWNEQVRSDPDSASKLLGHDFPPQPCDMRQQTLQGDVVQTPSKRPDGLYEAADLDELYEAAREFGEGLGLLLGSVATTAGLEAQQGPLKLKERAAEKINDQYVKQVSTGKKKPSAVAWLYDVQRGALSGDNVGELLAGIEQLRHLEAKPEDVKKATRNTLDKLLICRGKNRFKEPKMGYRDISLNIRLCRGSCWHMIELQFRMRSLETISKRQHEFYEFFRTHFSGSSDAALARRFELLHRVHISQASQGTIRDVVEKVVNENDVSSLNTLAELLDLLGEMRLEFLVRLQVQSLGKRFLLMFLLEFIITLY